jgi:hypothetical protein
MFKLSPIRRFLLNFFIFSIAVSEQAVSAQYLGREYEEDSGTMMGPVLGISYLIFALWIYNRRSVNNISKEHPVIAIILFIFVFPVIWVFLLTSILKG